MAVVTSVVDMISCAVVASVPVADVVPPQNRRLRKQQRRGP